MVFASGTSIRHLQTLSDAVERMTKNHKAKAVVQGRRNDSHWIVLGLPCIFLHLFLPEARLHYQLEKIWQPIQT
jgi:ribosome-associated protein